MAAKKQTAAEKKAEKTATLTGEAEGRRTDADAREKVEAKKSTGAAKTAKEKVKKPDVLDDLHTQEYDHATPGHFVDVVSGPHEGRYGVLVENAEGENVVVRTRDASSERILVKYGDLRPAPPGGRR